MRPVYAPALVAFIGGGGFSLALSTGAVAGIGWFPLGPGEVYRPSYAVSRNYFTSVNVTNTVVNTTVINNVYNNNVTNIVYRNRELAGAVTAVPTSAFSSAEPVARHASPGICCRDRARAGRAGRSHRAVARQRTRCGRGGGGCRRCGRSCAASAGSRPGAAGGRENAATATTTAIRRQGVLARGAAGQAA